MNDLGILLVGSIVRCTLVAALGVLLVVALRRQGPATGATIAATTLLVLIGVSGLAIAPWPRWWTVGSGAEGVRTPRSSSAKAPATSGAPLAMPPPHLGPVAPGPEAAPGLEAESRGAAGEIARVLLSTPRAGERTTQRWTWLPYIAPAFVAGLVFGLTRLLLGVRGVHTLRGRARPIDDAVLLEIVASLCAAMGRRPAVALLESDEVASPATVGWQRPAVILPPDWREWDGQERRVVLAHELAHICRGDYPIALAAQLSLALHFYHPLVYWLAGRLRLEQELAADAWGAAVVGGNHRYLATLARIALRESERPASWPARAFFSNRGTLLRRIEMLRESNPSGRVAPSRPARALMVTALVIAGLVVAGLRGPELPVPASAQTPARAQEKGPVATPTAGEECHFEVRNHRVTFIDLDRLYKLVKADARIRVRLADNQRVIESKVGPVGSFSMEYVLRRAPLGVESLMERQGFSFNLRGWELIPEYEGRGEPYETTRQPFSEYARTINRLSNEHATITMWVYPDGYPLYRKLRDDLHARGFLVAARPLPEGRPIKGSPSGSVSVPQ